MRTTRAEWAKRVERWADSGLTSKEFAAELGINPRSLVFWKWQLKRDGQGGPMGAREQVRRVARQKSVAKVPLVELRASLSETRIELELGSGRRLKIPAGFDVESLRRLLSVLEARP
jgi:transposase-like protein